MNARIRAEEMTATGQVDVSAEVAFDSMKGIVDSDALAEMVQKASERPMTPEEERANRISLAMGMVPSNSTITRERIEEVYDNRRY